MQKLCRQEEENCCNLDCGDGDGRVGGLGSQGVYVVVGRAED